MVTSSARVTVGSVVSVQLLAAAPVFAQSARDTAGASPEAEDGLPVEVGVTVSELQGRTVTASWTYQLQTVATPPEGQTRRARLQHTTEVRHPMSGTDQAASVRWNVGPDISCAVGRRADGRFLLNVNINSTIPDTAASSLPVSGTVDASASLKGLLRLKVEQTAIVTANQITQLTSMGNPLIAGASTRVDVTVTPFK